MSFSSIRRFGFAIYRRVMLLWVRSETIDSSIFEQLQQDPMVVYVLPQAFTSDLVVLDNECRKAQLKSLMDPLNSNNLAVESRYSYLREKPQWSGRKVKPQVAPMLKKWVHAVESGQVEDIKVVPVNVFWGQSPDRETSPWKLIFADSWAVTGRLRRFFTILFLGRKTRVQFAQPISIRSLVEQGKGEERTERLIDRVLRVHFKNTKTAVIGPDLSHRRTLVKAIIHEPAIQKAIAEEAQRENISLEKAQKKALRYAKEMASDYSYIAIRFLELVLSWFWNKFYDGINLKNIEGLREIAPGHEVIYVPCHRSHVDYLLLSYLLFANGLTPPHIAAGINLNMPVIGGLLRRGGAFFMRRTFKGNPLYTSVFNEYLHTLCRRGFPVEYFVEGGRSRTGRTLQPRTGMLAITLQNYLRSHRLPLVFVPVYIGYERVLEGKTYLGELRGKSKKKESFFDVFKVLASIRKQRFGKVAVNFGEPIKLTEFLNNQQPQWQEQSYDENAQPEWLRPTTHALAEKIATNINAAAAINPANLVAMVLLSTSRLALDEIALEKVLDLYLALLRSVPYSDFSSLPTGDGQSMIKFALEMKLIAQQEDALGRICYLDEQNAVLMTYYRNNVLHMFALPGLIMSYFHSNSRMSREQVIRFTATLYPFLRAELFIRFEKEQLEEVINQWLNAFLEQGILSLEGDYYQRPAPSSPRYVFLTLMARTISPTLQRFYMSLAILLNKGQYQLTAEELEQLSTVMAQRLSILHGINAPEFFDKTLFRHFTQTLFTERVLWKNAENKIGFTRKLNELVESVARRVLPAEIRLSIRQVTNDEDEFSPLT
ncbi:glycerol-3-phosphate 1-O-acyltransferase PlsB [Pseudomonas sp. F1_0610]|uniref:glycerol-3-phosphate 1-O-acyltransferase PlsB n=1 Tax=Pseudomonas sp. F1_0610 TaxID=3114284 RepID=UPI0039C4A10F